MSGEEAFNEGRSSETSSASIGAELLDRFSQKTFVDSGISDEGSVLAWEESNPTVEKHTITTVTEKGETRATLPAHEYWERAEETPPYDQRYNRIDPSISGTQEFFSNTPDEFSCSNCNDGHVRCSNCSSTGEVACSRCGGSGASDGDTCSKCNGSGVVTCSDCGGSGRLDCERCDGNGTMAEGLKAVFEYTERTERYPSQDKGVIPEDKITPANGVRIGKETGDETGGETLERTGSATPRHKIEHYVVPATRVDYEYGGSEWQFYELDGSLTADEYPKSTLRKTLTVAAVVGVLLVLLLVLDASGTVGLGIV